MIIVFIFICVISYYIYRAKYINDLEFYILVLILSLILFTKYTQIEKFTIEENDNILKLKHTFQNYIEKKQIKKKINNITNAIKHNINTTKINKLFSLIKQKLNGYKI